MKPEFVINRNGRDHVLYAGLLDLGHEQGLKAITTTIIQIPSDLNGGVAIVHAVVETSKGTFTGLGDAAADNVSRMMLPHLIRMAETRAKARALRDAVNVGMVALEETGDTDEGPAGKAETQGTWPKPAQNGAQKPQMAERELSRTPEGRSVAQAVKPSPQELYSALAAECVAAGYPAADVVRFTADAGPEHIRPEYVKLQDWLKQRQQQTGAGK